VCNTSIIFPALGGTFFYPKLFAIVCCNIFILSWHFTMDDQSNTAKGLSTPTKPKCLKTSDERSDRNATSDLEENERDVPPTPSRQELSAKLFSYDEDGVYNTPNRKRMRVIAIENFH
jgi:hypothetical protein